MDHASREQPAAESHRNSGKTTRWSSSRSCTIRICRPRRWLSWTGVKSWELTAYPAIRNRIRLFQLVSLLSVLSVIENRGSGNGSRKKHHNSKEQSHSLRYYIHDTVIWLTTHCPHSACIFVLLCHLPAKSINALSTSLGWLADKKC